MITIRIKHTCLLFLMLSHIGLAQVETPNTQPYTIQSTFEKLVKTYPDILPIEELKSDNIASDEHIIYQKNDNVTLQADVYYPKTPNQKYPAVILVHGGGWMSGSKENQRVMAQHLAKNGFVAMTVNYRLANEAKYPAAVEDLNTAIDFLHDSNYPVDTNQLAILGASAGAQLATLVGMKHQKIKAIINIDGIVSFIHPEAEEGQYAAFWLSGNKAENFNIWKEASPLEHIHPQSPAILFINSSQPRFHAGRDDLIKKYNDWNIYNETHTLPNSPHSFWLVHPWFQPTLHYIVEFLNNIFKQ